MRLFQTRILAIHHQEKLHALKNADLNPGLFRSEMPRLNSLHGPVR